ncbi:MAG: PEGA domain-containing protein, partial [Defluviitaleaceae bacterium]|nr:PEGA domain-containing protein [Defluviitaleaceae bacterium]
SAFAPPGGNGGGKRPPVTYKKRKTMFAAFYIVLILMAVGVCLTVFVIVFQNMVDNPPPNIFGGVPTPTPPPTFNIADRPDMRHLTGLVTSIDPFGDTRTVTLMDVSTRRSEEFSVPDNARLSTRLNMPMTFAELRVGHMVDISFDSRTSEVAALSESVHSWERRARTNVEINLEEATIHVGHESFNFNSQTLVLYRGEPFPIGQIRPVDSVTLVGLGDTAWLVQIDAAHGFLQFANSDIVINGTVMIGTNLFFALDDIENSLTLPEGAHQIVIEGDNIETFVHTILIEQGQTASLNLGDVELRAALLQIFVNPQDADVLINGELHDLSEGPVHVEFGEVLVRVERYGFMPQEERIEITRPINSITFNLVEIVIDSTLVIFTVPTNAQIFIENVFVGYSVLTHTIAPGVHRVTARLPGHEDTTYTVTVPPGEEVHRHMLLTPSPVYTPVHTPVPPVTAPPGGLPEVPPIDPFPNEPPIIPLPTPLPPTLPPDAEWPPMPIPTPPPDWPPSLEPTPTSPPTGTDAESNLPILSDENPFGTP